MNYGKISVLLFIFAFLVQPVSLFAQTSKSDWSAVRSLEIGTKISIETKDNRKVSGRLSGVSETGVTIATDTGTQTVDQTNIRMLFRNKGSAAKPVIIGAAVGAGVGAGAAAGLLGATGGSDSTNAILGKGIAIGAAVGAGIGALVGSRRKVLVYESR